ncbi:hypothetical protein [Saccharibacillus sp. JS10]|uniref:hypothetical protein n=1 Tax=Saccharibacillus sp. JS10 TaxID=2950552 RepID=UPI002108B97D|nr:hypothetical protein [Saccharibacillus sp. JS10]MCQ4086969.1 hypothetical protein [Saccharibacillus sp. JS10]
MKKRMIAIAVAASCVFAFQPQDAQAKYTPALLDNVLKGAVDVVDQTVGGVSDSVQQTVNGTTNVLEHTVSGTLNQTQQAVTDTLDATGKAAGGLLEPVTTPTANSVNEVVNTVDQVVKDTNVVVKETVDIPVRTVPQVTGALNGKAADPVGTLLEETGQTVKAVEQTVKNSTKSVGTVVESVGGVTQGTGQVVDGVVETVKETVKETAKPIIKPDIPTPSVPTLPPITPIKPTPSVPGEGNGNQPDIVKPQPTPTSDLAIKSPILSESLPSNAMTPVTSNSVPGQVVEQGNEDPIVFGEVLNPSLPENVLSDTKELEQESNPLVTPAGYDSVEAAEFNEEAENASLESEAIDNVFLLNEETGTVSTDERTVQENSNVRAVQETAVTIDRLNTEDAAPLAPKEGRQPQIPVMPGVLSENVPTRGTSGTMQSGSGSAGSQPPIAQLYAGFMPMVTDSFYRLKVSSDTEGSQWINAPPFSPPKQAPFLT